jgi:hypothetical protein
MDELKVFDVGEGKIVPVEFRDLPFKPQRTFWIYDVPDGKTRGNHAHVDCHQFIVAVSGGFRLQAEMLDAKIVDFEICSRERFFYAPPMTWALLSRFQRGTVCLVLASHAYDPEDYINDYQDYKKIQDSIQRSQAHNKAL